MSRRQLHEVDEVRQGAEAAFPARACGMEAEDEPQHRTQVKPRKAGPTWVSVLGNATPNIQPWRDGIEDGGGGTFAILTQGDLSGSVKAVEREEVNDERSMPREKSDLPIVAMKPGNAGGAKGEMG